MHARTHHAQGEIMWNQMQPLLGFYITASVNHCIGFIIIIAIQLVTCEIVSAKHLISCSIDILYSLSLVLGSIQSNLYFEMLT